MTNGNELMRVYKRLWKRQAACKRLARKGKNKYARARACYKRATNLFYKEAKATGIKPFGRRRK